MSQAKELLLASRVGEIVANDYRSAHLFSQFGIDFAVAVAYHLSVRLNVLMPMKHNLLKHCWH